MHHLLLGIAIGFVSIVPPGPVTVTLLQLGARHGRTPALRGALGIAFGDLTVVWLALAIVAAGSTLPPAALLATQVLAAALLIGLGLAMLARPGSCAAVVDRIERPARAFFLITSLTPTVLGAWIALLAAMPFADDVGTLVRFALGAVIASFLWHPVLALMASRLNDQRTHTQQRLARTGGFAMVAMGVFAAASVL
jgi:threonine/homoserine/homoserine lactone efflux protein